VKISLCATDRNRCIATSGLVTKLSYGSQVVCFLESNRLAMLEIRRTEQGLALRIAAAVVGR
jgi:hypothetical protein